MTDRLTLRHSGASQAILALAASQHGVVTRMQLLDAGVPPDTVDRRIASRLLRPLHRGVFAAGLPASAQGRALAALFACGSGAAVCRETAADLRGFLPGASGAFPVHVVLERGDRRRPGMMIHRTRSLRSDEITTLDGIRQTIPARTLLDLAATLTTRDLEKATVEALGKRLASLTELSEMVNRHAGRRGAARLRALLETGSSRPSRSTAERRFLALLARAGIPSPQANVRVAGFEVDAIWTAEKLIVEIDGLAFHATSGRVANDRRRDLALGAAGFRVLRITWHELVHSPEALVVQVTRALLASGNR